MEYGGRGVPARSSHREATVPETMVERTFWGSTQLIEVPLRALQRRSTKKWIVVRFSRSEGAMSHYILRFALKLHPLLAEVATSPFVRQIVLTLWCANVFNRQLRRLTILPL